MRAQSDSLNLNGLDLTPAVLRGTDSEDFFLRVRKVAPPPKHFAGWRTVAINIHVCLEQALELLQGANDEAKEFLQKAFNLAERAGSSETSEPSTAVNGLLTSHPDWCALFLVSNVPQSGYAAALGLLMLDALSNDKHMHAACAVDLRRKSEDIGAAQDLLSILCAPRHEVSEGPIWAKYLNRIWPQLRQYYSSIADIDASNDLSVADLHRKLLSTQIVYASTKHRAAIPDHRHLSESEIRHIGSQLELDLHAGGDHAQRAACAMLSWHVPFPLKHLADVPLRDQSHFEWTVSLDVHQGVWFTNIQSLAVDMAEAIDAEGHVMSCRVSAKPIPVSLHRYLQGRLACGMSCLGDLLPILSDIDSSDPVISSPRQIVPSFARWTNSSGVFTRRLQIDGLIAALLSNDFSLTPKSKLYYTCVQPSEIWHGSRQLFAALGWSEPTDMPSDLLPVGAAVVPTQRRMQEVFDWMQCWINSFRPSNRCELADTLNFHNRYATAVAWLVGFCVCSRRVGQIDWSAKYLDKSSRLLVLDDKSVPGFAGGLPVPVATLAQTQLQLYEKHLMAMHIRLSRKGGRFAAKALPWLNSVLSCEEVALFQSISSDGRVDSISTDDLIKNLPASIRVAVDAGRKYWETYLRKAGTETSWIDALLRHEVLGQERFSSSSDFNPSASFQALASQIDQHFAAIDVRPLIGLRS